MDLETLGREHERTGGSLVGARRLRYRHGGDVLVILWQTVIDKGPVALNGIFLLLVFVGLLVPRRTVRDRDVALAKERERNDNLTESLKSLLVYAEAADKILQELSRRIDGHDDRTKRGAP